ncbi:MAG: hypothetical protein JW818_14990 [Pirellulales bacterium]|nr:hypothetical protein [Pirellulales bacterium]
MTYARSLTHLVALVLILASTPLLADTNDMAAQRKLYAARHRRIIMNNDGNDTLGTLPSEKHTPEAFLARRTAGLVGSQVDAIFYCDGIFAVYTHRSEETERRRAASGGREYWAGELIEKGGKDPLEIITDWGHAHGIEVFWSMRMNDTHDSSPAYAKIMPRWKREHPDLMMAPKPTRFPYGSSRWSSVDYGKAEVRDKVFRILRDVATRYDVDGLELDFLRHPMFFKPQLLGEPVTQEHCDRMTSLLARVRAMADEVGRRRGRPVLIAVRVPDSVRYSKAIGLDLEAWLKRDLVDLLIGAGQIHLEPWKNLVALGRRHGVPVYAGLSPARLEPRSGDRALDLPLWRGEALRAWDAGVDGVSTFNVFDPASPVFRQIGDPFVLRRLPRRYQFIPGKKGYLNRLKGGEKYVVPDE